MKNYKLKLESFQKNEKYSLNDAIEILKNMPSAKFDETIDLAFKLGINPRQTDQAVRGAINLPHGTGKSISIVVAAEGDAAKSAKEAGADEVGLNDLITKIKNGWLDFDILIATPDAMKEVRTLGKFLGPRGLMPNPKTGTVTLDTAKAVKDAKAGRTEYKSDKSGNAHTIIGKKSFDVNQLIDNAKTVIKSLNSAKPSSSKGVFLTSCTMSSTMSPGIKIDLKELQEA